MMKKGFTLIELTVVLVILAFGLVTILLVLRNASVNNMNAHFITVAGELADGMMEEIMSARRSGNFGAAIDVYNGYHEDYDSYDIDVDVCTVNGPKKLNEPLAGTNYKRVDVTVTRPDIATNVILSTVVTDY